jgi:Tfp pilus assembly protein PilO
MENYVYYAPIILLVMMFFIQEKIFVTPEQLEKKHREVIRDVEKRFATQENVEDLKNQFADMKEKIDKIYDCLILQ